MNRIAKLLEQQFIKCYTTPSEWEIIAKTNSPNMAKASSMRHGLAITHALVVQYNWDTEIYGTKYCIVDNMLTLSFWNVENNNELLGVEGAKEIVNAIWIVQKGLLIKSERGYIVTDSKGGVFHSPCWMTKTSLSKLIHARGA